MKITTSIIGLFLCFYASSQMSYETYCYSDNSSEMMQAPSTTGETTKYYSSMNGANFPANGTKRMILTK